MSPERLSPMQICVLIEESNLRRWVLDLLNRIGARPDARVVAQFHDAGRLVATEIDALFHIETRLHDLPRDGPATIIERSAFGEFPQDLVGLADLTIDLRSNPDAARPGTWRIRYDGVYGEAALVEAALDRRAPLMEIVADDRVVAAGRLGTESGAISRAAFEDMVARASTLVVAAIEGRGAAAVPTLPSDRAWKAPAHRRFLSMAIDRVLSKAARELYRLVCDVPHWRVGWRKIEGPDVFDLRRHPEGGWNEMPDDGRRFYADPFPIDYRGRVFVFLEEFEHRLGKGVISVVEFGPRGPISAPQPVLERPGHLSYPFVFERDGEVWMVPESCSAGRIDLYRATRFPEGWVHEATLVADLVASDATLFERGGVWWMFATVRDGGGAFSDALHLWRANDFRGPWAPHPRNPVLIDIASARPAGRLVERRGVMYRPVQDCRAGYGAALGIARLDRLDEEGFVQTLETILQPGPSWKGSRLHTLNAAGGFEFIDGSSSALRSRRDRCLNSLTRLRAT